MDIQHQLFPKKSTRILGIETSCDETAAAIVENGRIILSSFVASQVDLHAKYGGVFPEVASRQHILTISGIIDQAFQEAHLGLNEIDAIAVTYGPGLAGSLVVGVNVAKGLCLSEKKPLIGINHLEGHIYSAWLYQNGVSRPPSEPQFPLVILLVSGGHTQLYLMLGHKQFQTLGRTLDDAVGEAFDKVARLLNLGYPGGPVIQKAAGRGNPRAFSFPRARLEGSWDFSFSGLKTAVLREVRKIEENGQQVPVDDLAASFQAAVVDVLVSKTLKAATKYQAKEVLVAGGVSANLALREAFLSQKDFSVHIPSLSLCTDNAAMIAAAGYYSFIENRFDSLDIDVIPNLAL